MAELAKALFYLKAAGRSKCSTYGCQVSINHSIDGMHVPMILFGKPDV